MQQTIKLVSAFLVSFYIFGESSATAQVSLTSRFSSVMVSDFETGSGEQKSTNQFGLFDESVSLDSSFATSTSLVSSSVFDIDVTSQGGTSVVFTESVAYSLVEFEVESTLIAHVDGLFSTNDAGNNAGAVWAELTQSGSQVFLYSLVGEELLLDDTFVLSPGEYRFETNAVSMGDSTLGALLDADFTVSFASVPEPMSFPLVMIALGFQFLRRKKPELS